jgi:hypothetical protein
VEVTVFFLVGKSYISLESRPESIARSLDIKLDTYPILDLTHLRSGTEFASRHPLAGEWMDGLMDATHSVPVHSQCFLNCFGRREKRQIVYSALICEMGAG